MSCGRILNIINRNLLPQFNGTTFNFAQRLHCQAHPCLAGHSKWANIRHTKAIKDADRSALFAKLARQLRLAIQEGGSADPGLNSTLRSVVDEALRKNMPMSTIQNSIKKCSEASTKPIKKHQVQLQYKKGVFAVCILYSENFVGLKMEMATLLRRAGAKFVEASHLFDDMGVIEAFADMSKVDSKDLEDRVTADAIECGAEEVDIISAEKGAVNFICNVIEMPAVRRELETRGYKIMNAEHVFIPKNVVELSEEEHAAYDVFLQKLRNLSGVEDIYDNVEIMENTKSTAEL